MAMLDLRHLTGDKPLTILQALVNQVSQRAALPPASSQPSIGTLLFAVDVWDGLKVPNEKVKQKAQQKGTLPALYPLPRCLESDSTTHLQREGALMLRRVSNGIIVRNKKQLNAKRQKQLALFHNSTVILSIILLFRTLKLSEEAIIENTAVVSGQGAQKKRDFGTDTSFNRDRCSRHTAATCREDEEALPNQISSPTKEEDEYWKIKLLEINYTLAHIGAGKGTDHEYMDSVYRAAREAPNDQQAYNTLEKFHSRLEKLRAYIIKFQGLVLDYLGNGDMYQQYEDMRVRASG
ncbi:hypothetical protein Moror_13563 [Moniliophthora roreri MCA 2997]|uniref:Uncharacterized protein n=1 Tax=Moniliophthora roreri (strain MCA 2997) TaxID=1381753 RepID=V2XWK6_MONRO|nr:hypothetical protein Moror_13563 [Moniliophthora roreri MCA 2997]